MRLFIQFHVRIVGNFIEFPYEEFFIEKIYYICGIIINQNPDS